MRFLLDANVLIAYLTLQHPHHPSAESWVLANPQFAVCPMTEGALLRYIFQTDPSAGQTARTVLDALKQVAGYEFWGDDISFETVQVERLIGRNQATDAYLVELARSKGGKLATFDAALAATHSDAVLVPIT